MTCGCSRNVGRMSVQQPETPPLYAGDPHQARQIAESFGSDTERYDRARPSYPDAMIERIVGGSPGPRDVLDVLDVGTGTGISARQFQAVGCRVLGVEVDPRMAETARRTGVDVEVGVFEDWRATGRNSTPSSRGRHGIGWTRSRERPRRQRCYGLAAGWPCSGTSSSRHQTWAKPSPPSIAACCPTRPSAAERPAFVGTRDSSPRQPTASGLHRPSACGAVAVRLGADLRTGRMARPGAHLRGLQRLAGGHHGRAPDGHRGRNRCVGGSFTMAYATVVVTATRNGDGS